MKNILSKYAELEQPQILGMIGYAKSQYPFLDSTSDVALYKLVRLMFDNYFMSEKKPTPILATYKFLTTVAETTYPDAPEVKIFAERDFVFAVKMFGLRIRDKNGVMQFVPDNQLDSAEDEEVLIDSAKAVKALEYYISGVKKSTKIHTNAIESATGTLLRDWREMNLAVLFSKKMKKDGMTIGQARDFLIQHEQVKTHEFVRIREHAVDMGLFTSKRNPSKINRRITLDDDVYQFVSTLMQKGHPSKKGPMNASDAVNAGLRDLYRLTHDGAALPSASDE